MRAPIAPVSAARRILVGALVSSLAHSSVALAQIPSDWFGTWTLNVAKSAYSAEPPYRRATRRIMPTDEGMTIVDDLVRPRGGILHLEWTGKLDGVDHAVQGVEVVLTNAYRRVDDRTWEVTQRIDGAVVAITRLTLSSDGKTINSVSSSKSERATTIYEKQ